MDQSPASSQASRHSVRRSTLLASVCLALAFGAGAGWVAAELRDRARAIERALADAVAHIPDATGHGAGASADAADGESISSDVFLDALSDNIALGERVRDLESLIETIRDLGANPLELVDMATDRLSDSDLERILKLAMRLDDEQLAGVEDLRAFTHRVAEVAMDGTFGDPSPIRDETSVGLSDRRPSRSTTGVEDAVFAAQTERVYAIFELDAEIDEVAVKWFRRDRPEILLLERHSIAPGQDRSWVWLAVPDGLDLGEYQIDIYGADEEMERLAVGRFSVAEARD